MLNRCKSAWKYTFVCGKTAVSHIEKISLKILISLKKAVNGVCRSPKAANINYKTYQYKFNIKPTIIRLLREQPTHHQAFRRTVSPQAESAELQMNMDTNACSSSMDIIKTSIAFYSLP